MRIALVSLLLGACAPPLPSPLPTVKLPRLQVAVTVDDLPIHGPAFPGIDRREIAIAELRRGNVETHVGELQDIRMA